MPGQASKRNMKKIFLQRYPLSRFMAKTLRVNKPAMEKVLKNLWLYIDFAFERKNTGYRYYPTYLLSVIVFVVYYNIIACMRQNETLGLFYMLEN